MDSYDKIALLLLVCFIIYKIYKTNRLTHVVSDIDGRSYQVQKMRDNREAANFLAELKQDIVKFVEHLHKNRSKHPKYEPYINRVHKKIHQTEFLESTGHPHTSYSVNKGEKIVCCLRSKDSAKFHDKNIVMYVLLHEISHVACPEFGHTPLFKDIFHFFVTEAIQIGMYKKKDYTNQPEEYCGIMVTDSIVG